MSFMRAMTARRWFAAPGLALAAAMLAGCPIRAVTARKQAQAAVARAQIQQATVFVELFHLNLGRYPTDQEGLNVLLNPPADPAEAAKWKEAGGPFMPNAGVLKDPWGQPLRYHRLAPAGASGEAFRIWSIGPDGQDGTPDDVSSTGGIGGTGSTGGTGGRNGGTP